MDNIERNFDRYDGSTWALLDQIGRKIAANRVIIEENLRSAEKVKAQLRALDEAYPELWIRKHP